MSGDIGEISCTSPHPPHCPIVSGCLLRLGRSRIRIGYSEAAGQIQRVARTSSGTKDNANRRRAQDYPLCPLQDFPLSSHPAGDQILLGGYITSPMNACQNRLPHHRDGRSISSKLLRNQLAALAKRIRPFVRGPSCHFASRSIANRLDTARTFRSTVA